MPLLRRLAELRDLGCDFDDFDEAIDLFSSGESSPELPGAKDVAMEFSRTGDAAPDTIASQMHRQCNGNITVVVVVAVVAVVVVVATYISRDCALCRVQ